MAASDYLGGLDKALAGVSSPAPTVGGSSPASPSGGDFLSRIRPYHAARVAAAAAPTSHPGLWDQLGGVLKAVPMGLVHLGEEAGRTLPAVLGIPQTIDALQGKNPFAGGAGHFFKHYYPLGTSVEQSFQRTGSDIIHPTHFARAYKAGTLVPKLVEDIGNAAIVLGPLAKGIGGAAGAARLEATAASEAAQAARAVSAVFPGRVTPVGSAAFSGVDEAATAAAARAAKLGSYARPFGMAAKGVEAGAGVPFLPFRLAYKGVKAGAEKVAELAGVEGGLAGTGIGKRVAAMQLTGKARTLETTSMHEQGQILMRAMDTFGAATKDLTPAESAASRLLVQQVVPIRDIIDSATRVLSPEVADRIRKTVTGVEQAPTPEAMAIARAYRDGTLDPAARERIDRYSAAQREVIGGLEQQKLNLGLLSPEQVGHEAMPGAVAAALRPREETVAGLKENLEGVYSRTGELLQKGARQRAAEAEARIEPTDVAAYLPRRTIAKAGAHGEALGEVAGLSTAADRAMTTAFKYPTEARGYEAQLEAARQAKSPYAGQAPIAPAEVPGARPAIPEPTVERPVVAEADIVRQRAAALKELKGRQREVQAAAGRDVSELAALGYGTIPPDLVRYVKGSPNALRLVDPDLVRPADFPAYQALRSRLEDMGLVGDKGQIANMRVEGDWLIRKPSLRSGASSFSDLPKEQEARLAEAIKSYRAAQDFISGKRTPTAAQLAEHAPLFAGTPAEVAADMRRLPEPMPAVEGTTPAWEMTAAQYKARIEELNRSLDPYFARQDAADEWGAGPPTPVEQRALDELYHLEQPALTSDTATPEANWARLHAAALDNGLIEARSETPVEPATGPVFKPEMTVRQREQIARKAAAAGGKAQGAYDEAGALKRLQHVAERRAQRAIRGIGPAAERETGQAIRAGIREGVRTRNARLLELTVKSLERRLDYHMGKLDAEAARLARGPLEVAPGAAKVPLLWAEHGRAALSQLLVDAQDKVAGELGYLDPVAQAVLQQGINMLPKDIAGLLTETGGEFPEYVPGGFDQPVPSQSGRPGSGLPKLNKLKSQHRKTEGNVLAEHPALVRAIVADSSKIAKSAAARAFARPVAEGGFTVTAHELVGPALESMDRTSPEAVSLQVAMERGGHDLTKVMDRAGYASWNPKTGERVPETDVTAATLFLPTPLIEQFKKSFITPGSLPIYDSLTHAWRHAVLGANPMWNIGNVVGNGLLTTVAGGVSPIRLITDFREAVALMKSREGPPLLWGQGGANEALLTLDRQMQGPGNFLTRTLHKSYAMNQWVDDFGHAIVYLDRVRKGASPEVAVAESLKIMGNFSKMTPFERQFVRRVYPFYAWTRHVTQLAWHLAVYHPLRTAFTLHLATITESPDDMRKLLDMPGFLQSALPVGVDKFFPMARFSPFDQIGAPVVLDPRRALAGVNPILQAAAFKGLGLNLRSGRQATRPPYDVPKTDTGGTKFGGTGWGQLAYYLSQATPQTRFLEALTQRNVAHYDTGEEIKRRGQTIPLAGSRYEELARALGLPVPITVKVAEYQARQAKAAAARKKLLVRAGR